MKNFWRRTLRIFLALGIFVFSRGNFAQTTNALIVVDTPQMLIPGLSTIPRGQLTFGLDRIGELRMLFFGIPLWQYLATAIYILSAILAARIFNYLVKVQLRKVAAKTKNRLDDLIIELLHGPVKILAFFVLLQFGLNLFQWPHWLGIWLANGFKLVLACSLTYMAIKLVDLAVSYWSGRTVAAADKSFNELLLPLLSRSLKGFIIIMAVLLTLDNLNINIRTLLAGVSVSGLALGLAAQDTVGNLFGAAAVFLDKPFRIGDRIQLNGIDGTVEQMGLRSTRIRHLDGYLITVPNKTMGNATITNITRRPNVKTVLNLGLTYDTPSHKVTEATRILEEVFGKHPMTADLTIGFNQFTDSSLNINVVHLWKEFDNKAYVAGMQALNLEVKTRFENAGIAFAFPSRTVYLRQDNEWRVQSSDVPEPPASAQAAGKSS